MKYSAISDCGSEEQRVSLPSVAELAGELDRDDRALGGVDVEVGDLARVDARDPHVRARDETERVVHLDLVRVRVVGAGGRREHGDRGGDQGEDEGDPPHGPGST